MSKHVNKLVASIIIAVLMVSYVTIVADACQVFAASVAETRATNREEVDFDVYFKVGEEQVHNDILTIDELGKLYVDVAVKDGYLKDARIDLKDSNFVFAAQENLAEGIESLSETTITLNKVSNGEKKVIEIPTSFIKNETLKAEDLKKTSKLEVVGTLVDKQGTETTIRKDIDLEVSYEINATSVIESKVTKYVPFDIEGARGILLEETITAGVQDNKIPVTSEVVSVRAPIINSVAPEQIKVLGTDGVEVPYEYVNGIVTIKEEKIQGEDGSYAFQNSLDEFKLIYRYGNTAVSDTEVSVEFEGSAVISMLGREEAEEVKYYHIETLKDQISGIVGYELATTNAISKGYMYANYDKVDNKVETKYAEIITANIGDTSLTDSLNIDVKQDTIAAISEEGSIETPANIYINRLQVMEDNFKEILGEEGNVRITVGDAVVAEINKNVEAVGGIYEVDLAQYATSELSIETTKPEAIGLLSVGIEKSIIGENNLPEEELTTKNAIMTNVIGRATSKGFEFVNQARTDAVVLTEPTLDAELVIDRDSLTTTSINENVQLKAILKTDTLDCKLYENPRIVISLPSYIESINIKSIEVLYDNELKVNGYAIENGQLIIDLLGTQTEYNLDSLTEGTNVVITADILINNLTVTQDTVLTMNVINAGETFTTENTVKAVSPSGMIILNSLTADGMTYNKLAGQDEQVNLRVNEEAKEISVYGKVINNYGNNIDSIKVLGMISSDNLPVILSSRVEANGTVLYSEKADAEIGDDSWTTEPTQNTKMYSIDFGELSLAHGEEINFLYKAMVPENLNYEMESNENYTVYFNNNTEIGKISDGAISANYNLTTGVENGLEVTLDSEIPANSVVREGQVIKFNGKVNNKSDALVKNVRVLIDTPQIDIYVYEENGTTKYTTDATIPGTVKIGNVEISNVEYKEEAYFTGYRDIGHSKTIYLNDIEANGSKEYEYVVQIKKFTLLPEYERLITYPEMEMISKVLVSSASTTGTVSSNTYNFKVEKGGFLLTTEASTSTNRALLKGDKITYTTIVETLHHEQNMKNLNIKAVIPAELAIEEATAVNFGSTTELGKHTINTTGNTVNFDMPEFDEYTKVKFIVTARVIGSEGEVSPVITAKADGIGECRTNTLSHSIKPAAVSIEQLRLENQYVKEGEDITFTYNVKNENNVFINKVDFETNIPSEYTFKNATSTFKGVESNVGYIDGSDKLEVNLQNVEGDMVIPVKVTLTANKLPEGTTQKDVETVAKATINDSVQVTSNTVTSTIEYNKESHERLADEERSTTGEGENTTPTDLNQPNINVSRNVISGIVWIDRNKNGQLDEGEAKLSGVTIVLLDKAGTTLVKQTQSGTNGAYQFEGIDNGEYIIVFEYNANRFVVTNYKAAGVPESINSDAVAREATIDGKTEKVAVSDVIAVSDSNARNINLGLYESVNSDLSINKEVTSIIVSNSTGTVEYRYEGSNRKLAKRELTPAHVNDSTLTIKYAITVKNEGEIGEYVKKIADFVPSQLTFASELNPTWTTAENGVVINTSLANTMLNPGEARTIELILTMKTSDDKMTVINNSAEIYESYNDLGVTDRDSMPGNKNAKEDDYSSADIILSIRTGGSVEMYIGLAITIIFTLAVGTYYTRKEVLRRVR